MHFLELLQIVLVAPDGLAQGEIVFLENPYLQMSKLRKLPFEALLVFVRNICDGRMIDRNIEPGFRPRALYRFLELRSERLMRVDISRCRLSAMERCRSATNDHDRSGRGEMPIHST